MFGFRRKIAQQQEGALSRQDMTAMSDLIKAAHDSRIAMNNATSGIESAAARNARGGIAMILQGLNILKGGEPTHSNTLSIIARGMKQTEEQLEALPQEARDCADAFHAALERFRDATSLDLLDETRLVTISRER